MNSDIAPPPNYKTISYKEWGGRFLPKTAIFLLVENWVPVKVRTRMRFLNKTADAAIPNNHVPRKTLRENKKILNAVAEFESAMKGTAIGKMRAIGQEEVRKTNLYILGRQLGKTGARLSIEE